MTTRVAVIGGGPAGLYLARLLKLQSPEWEVVVHERMTGSSETFGFGVGLTGSTMRNLTDADPVTAESVRDISFAGHDLQLRSHGQVATLHGARNLAVGRAALLHTLAEAAADIGVEIRSGSTADATTVQADIVVAADGVGSSTRLALAAELGVHTNFGRTRFVWCGTDFAVDAAFFCAVERGRSMFVAHAYPYAADRSTFLIEVDDETWADSGLGGFDEATPHGTTDESSVRLLEDVFSDQLRHRRLLTNRTRWSRFTELSLDRWSAGNVVLIGDAAHTAHYTLGSGTKLAMEDAIALAAALRESGSVGDAFAAYEAARRPAVDRFKALARRSQAWWDSYRARAGWEPAELAISFMTRSGNLSLADYAKEQPDVVREGVAWLGADAPVSPAALDDWVLSRSVGVDGGTVLSTGGTWDQLPGSACRIEWSEPDVWGEQADTRAQEVMASPGSPVVLVGPEDAAAVNARVDFAERVRLTTGRSIGVALTAAERELAASAVAARRAAFVVFE